MAHSRDAVAVRLLTILQEPNSAKARERYLEWFELQEIDDQAVYDQLEELVFDAAVRADPTVTIDSGLAQTVLLLLKCGSRRQRGGQRNTRNERLRKRTLTGMAQETKAKLIASGMSATEAHLQAAEETAEEGRRRGLNYAAGYLAREMQGSRRRH